MTDAELAFRMGELFNRKITAAFWDSFKGEYGRTQIEVLLYLNDHAEVKGAELSAELDVPKQHISKIVKGFLADGLIAARQSSDDQRVNILSLTEEGKALLEAHYRISDVHFNMLIQKLSAEQAEQFRESMKQMADILTML